MPLASMSGTLVLYATREGQTEKVAARITMHLEKLGQEVRLVSAGDTGSIAKLNLCAFDRLVFGASVHAGGLERELVEFINSHSEQISRQPRSFFVVLLSAATKDPALRANSLADAHRQVTDQLHVRFHDMEFIAGALKYSKYAWPLKWLMKRIAKQAGERTNMGQDYEYTDWQQVERYAMRLGTT